MIYTHLFPTWFDLFSVYLHSYFTASIIFDSLLEYLNGTTILAWYQSHLRKASCLFLSIEHQKQLGLLISPTKGTLFPLNLFRVVVSACRTLRKCPCREGRVDSNIFPMILVLYLNFYKCYVSCVNILSFPAGDLWILNLLHLK